jgi:hypothetical protein
MGSSGHALGKKVVKLFRRPIPLQQRGFHIHDTLLHSWIAFMWLPAWDNYCIMMIKYHRETCHKDAGAVSRVLDLSS